MMKSSLFLLLSIVTFAAAKPASTSEYDLDDGYFWIPDEQGRLHLVNTNIVPKFVDPIDSNNITFALFTRTNLDDPVLFHPHELDVLIASGLFDTSRPTLFNTHGWTGDGGSVHLVEVKDTLLEKHDFNVINIDWGGPASTFYTQAVQYVNPMGDMIGEFINSLSDYYQYDHSEIGIMGHSLGGQLIGRVGYACQGRLAYIISLDPAYPMFSGDVLENKLDTSDAQYVQVIHANSGFLGYPDSIGHADFHPNGGVKQPGCGPDIIGTCSHFLIKDMIAESYVNTYLSWRCDSYEDFVAGLCDDNETGYWGGWPVDTQSSGDYYLTTNGEPPFVIQ